MSRSIFWVSCEIAELLLSHQSLNIFTHFMERLSVSWALMQFNWLLPHHSSHVVLFCWPYPFVVKTYVVIEIVLYLVHFILKTCKRTWRSLAFWNRRQVIKLALYVFDILLDGPNDSVNRLKFSRLLFATHEINHADRSTSFIFGDTVYSHPLLLRNVT